MCSFFGLALFAFFSFNTFFTPFSLKAEIKQEKTIDPEKDNKPKTLLEKISNINMQTFPWENDRWSTTTYKEFLTKYTERALNPKAKWTRQRAFDLFVEAEKEQPKKASISFNDEHTWNDLNLFCGQKDKTKFVGDAIDKSQTEYGKVALYTLLANPIDRRDRLIKRQNIIKYLAHNNHVFSSLEQSFKKLCSAQEIMLLFWRDNDPLYKQIKDWVLFNNALTKPLNSSEGVLTLKSLYDHQTRLWWLGVSVIASLSLTLYGFSNLTGLMKTPKTLEKWALRYKDGNFVAWIINTLTKNPHIIGATTFASGIFTSCNIPHQFEWFTNGFLFEKTLQILMKPAAESIEAMQKIYIEIKQHKELCDFDEFNELEKLFTQSIKISNELKHFLYLVNDETLQQKPSLFSDKGVILKAYELLFESKKFLQQALVALGHIDAYLGLARLIKESEQQENKFCFAHYLDAEQPTIELTNFWHPIIGQKEAINNSISIGGKNRRNIVITGPNAGGKSTTIKAMTIALIMGQTVGIAPARTCAFTPFSSIATYLNITDDIGVGNSLFKSEVVRTQELLDKLNELEKDQFSFTIFDEVFNGTSPVEGEAAAYSIAHHLDEYKKNICVIATHFPMLTLLDDVTDSYSNYKVSVTINRDGTISYPYKLSPGVSEQHIAIDILRNEGFKSSILDEANDIIALKQPSV